MIFYSLLNALDSKTLLFAHLRLIFLCFFFVKAGTGSAAAPERYLDLYVRDDDGEAW